MKNTSRNVPVNSATYAGHSRSSTAVSLSVERLRAAAILCRRRVARRLARADVEGPARLALSAHVPAHVDPRGRAGAHPDDARQAAALRPAVVGPRPGIVEVPVDDGVRRAGVRAVDEHEVDALALAHDVLLLPGGR